MPRLPWIWIARSRTFITMFASKLAFGASPMKSTVAPALTGVSTMAEFAAERKAPRAPFSCRLHLAGRASR
jgi:hypothetical protein